VASRSIADQVAAGQHAWTLTKRGELVLEVRRGVVEGERPGEAIRIPRNARVHMRLPRENQGRVYADAVQRLARDFHTRRAD
jgi:hypothetical protein